MGVVFVVVNSLFYLILSILLKHRLGNEKLLIKDLLNKKIDKVDADSLEKGERSSGKSEEKVKYVP